MKQNNPPKRIASTIINALKGGVVPRVGLEYITVGRKREIEALLHDIDIIADGGAAFRFIVGKYGSGKSFLLQTVRNYATERGFVVVDADLSPERRFVGAKGQGLAVYKELVKNMSTKTKPDGGALPLILERWISGVRTSVAVEKGLQPDDAGFNREVEKRIQETASKLEGLVNGFEFARAVMLYYRAYAESDDALKSSVIRWFRGEYNTKTESKQQLGINMIITDDTWYDFIKILASFMVCAGYKGMLVIVDELVNIYKINQSGARQSNYEKILTMYNDVLQGKAQHIGFFLGGTPQCIEDKYRGVYSYEALRSRLAEGRFSSARGTRDMFSPIIRLEMLKDDEMYVLIEKLTAIHALLFDYTPRAGHNDYINFLQIEYERVGARDHITPREIIRDYIELLNILYQNPDENISEILKSDDFTPSVIQNEYEGTAPGENGAQAQPVTGASAASAFFEEFDI